LPHTLSLEGRIGKATRSQLSVRIDFGGFVHRKRLIIRGSSALRLVLLMAAATAAGAQSAKETPAHESPPYLGFDRNDYPGDAALPSLRKTFHYTGYWLNNPPGETVNSWTGKRAILRENGFGFLVLFTGRTDAEIRSAKERAGELGLQDGKAAVVAAVREGFASNVLIFLDQEEGGRLLPEQAAYLFAWADAVRSRGARPGVYCSGIEVPDGSGSISTARDLVEKESTYASAGKTAEQRISLWIADDQCPPAPGCTTAAPRLESGVSVNLRRSVVVWQYALSPRRPQFSASCPQNQAHDGNCYAPGLAANARVFVDLDTANSPDPSESSD